MRIRKPLPKFLKFVVGVKKVKKSRFLVIQGFVLTEKGSFFVGNFERIQRGEDSGRAHWTYQSDHFLKNPWFAFPKNLEINDQDGV